MEFKIKIADELLPKLGEWTKCAGFKVVVDGDEVEIIFASDSAALAAAIRNERTPKVASPPGDPGGIRWR